MYNMNMKNHIILFSLIIFTSCSIFHDNVKQQNNSVSEHKHNGFILSWYINNDESQLNAAIENEINPYAPYFSLYMVYSHNRYNKTDNHMSADYKKIHQYLSQYPEIDFIADLPRYSTLYRNIFIPFDGELLKHPYIKTSLFTSELDSIQHAYAPIMRIQSAEPAIYMYDMSTEGNNIASIVLTNEFFLNKNNASVYRNADIIDFSVKLIDNSSLFLISIHKNESHFIISNSQDFAYMYQGKNNIADTVIIFNNIYNWQIESLFLDSLSGDNSYIKKMHILGKNVFMGPVVFKYSYEKCADILKMVIDSIYEHDNLMGFYLIDEIEYKEMLCLDRWKDGEKTDKKSYPLISLVEMADDYIEKKGKIAFSLSSAGYNYQDSLLMLSDNYHSLRNNIFMFDTYSYRDDYIDAIIQARKSADKRNSRLIIVNDAYSGTGKKALPFYLMKFKFFTGFIYNANGMLYYTYSRPFVNNLKDVLNDDNKVNIGMLGKFVYDYDIIDMYDNKRYNYILKNENRASLVMSKNNTICFIFSAINGHDNYYDPCSMGSIDFRFNTDNPDINQLLENVHDSVFAILDISPYSCNKNSALSGISFINSAAITEKDNILNTLNTFPFNHLFHPYDIRIIMLIPLDTLNNDELKNRYPQLIINGEALIDNVPINLNSMIDYQKCMNNVKLIKQIPFPYDSIHCRYIIP